MEYNVNGTLKSCSTLKVLKPLERNKIRGSWPELSFCAGEEMVIFKETVVTETHLYVEQFKITVDRERLVESTRDRIQELRSLDSFSGEKLTFLPITPMTVLNLPLRMQCSHLKISVL